MLTAVWTATPRNPRGLGTKGKGSDKVDEGAQASGARTGGSTAAQVVAVLQ